jgi:pilus assembly protein CpaB
MDKKKIVLLLSALVIAALTAFMARTMFGSAAAPQAKAVAPPVPTGPEVLVATRALPMGTIITADALRFQPWPKELIDQAYFTREGKAETGVMPSAGKIVGAAVPEEQASPEELIGTVVRNPITAGQPITKSSLVSPGDRGFLAAALSPGMRAISIPVSAKTAVAGFIFPGDRVDVFLTQRVASDFGPAMKVSETILRNVRVLATDKQASPTVTKDGKTVVKKYKLITLEATPRMAEQLTVAQSLGSISLSLRALADNAAELEKALASGSVTIPEGASPEEERRILNSINERPILGSATYSTGGDVSRFQRKSIARIPTTAVQEAVRNVRDAGEVAKASREVQKIYAGPIVKVSRAGLVTDVELDRR